MSDPSEIGAALHRLLTVDRASWRIAPQSSSAFIDHPCGVSLAEVGGNVLLYCREDVRPNVLTPVDVELLAPLVSALREELTAARDGASADVVRKALGLEVAL